MSCAAGETPVSTGAHTDRGYGDVAVKSMRTGAYAGSTFGMAAAAEDEDGTTSSWDLWAEVVCVW